MKGIAEVEIGSFGVVLGVVWQFVVFRCVCVVEGGVVSAGKTRCWDRIAGASGKKLWGHFSGTRGMSWTREQYFEATKRVS